MLSTSLKCWKKPIKILNFSHTYIYTHMSMYTPMSTALLCPQNSTTASEFAMISEMETSAFYDFTSEIHAPVCTYGGEREGIFECEISGLPIEGKLAFRIVFDYVDWADYFEREYYLVYTHPAHEGHEALTQVTDSQIAKNIYNKLRLSHSFSF